MRAPFRLSLDPVRARWFYAAAACVLSLGMFFAPSNAYVGFAIALLAALLGYGMGRREDNLRRDSSRDPLTGLFNRGYFELTFLRELALCARDGRSVALLVIDVDALKKINDGGGHDAGDGAIRAVADALRECCRSSDLAARWGGDEFVVLAPSTSKAQALALARRISDRLTERTAARVPPAPVTVSIGVAVAEGDLVSSSQMFAHADAEMYENKQRAGDGPPPGSS